MTDTSDATLWLSETLKDGGFRGRGSIWRMKGPEVQWVVHIDRLPYGQRLAIDVGLDLQLEKTPRRPTDCAILLHLDNMPPSKKYELLEALDMTSGLGSEQRRQELVNQTQALVDYVTDHLTIDAVRHAYRTGDFEKGFIHKDVRAILDA